MNIPREHLAPRYRHILDTCEPFLVTWRGNLKALDLAPFGFAIPEERRYDPTSLRSRGVIDGLHLLDGFSFGPQEMLMPRWVLFDCGEFPGIVYGFGRRARDLSLDARQAYGVTDPEAFVPLSMWVAIRCAEEGAWFGHNLSSANLVLREEPLAGLGTLTKALGMRLARIVTQYGATQWQSSSVRLHLTYGELELLSAYTPAHTHEETLSYRLPVDWARVGGCLLHDFKRPAFTPDLTFVGDDTAAIHALHARIEAGEAWRLAGVQSNPDGAQRILLRQG